MTWKIPTAAGLSLLLNGKRSTVEVDTEPVSLEVGGNVEKFRAGRAALWANNAAGSVGRYRRACDGAFWWQGVFLGEKRMIAERSPVSALGWIWEPFHPATRSDRRRQSASISSDEPVVKLLIGGGWIVGEEICVEDCGEVGRN